MTTHVLLDYLRYVPPLASNFATTTYGTNSENPTKTDTTGRGLKMDFGNTPAAGYNVRAFTKTKPASSNYDIIARIRVGGILFNHTIWGLCATDGTKFILFGFGATASNAYGYRLSTFATKTSTPTDVLSDVKCTPHTQWLKIGVVSNAFTDFYLSENGTDWIKVLSSSQSAFLTMTEIGIAQLCNQAGSAPLSGTNQMTMSVLYYSDPDIVPAV